MPNPTRRATMALPGALALAALGFDLASGEAGWGAFVAAAAALAFFHAGAIEKHRAADPPPSWLASRKGGIMLGVPFALAGLWTGGLVAIAAYAAGSFLWLQRNDASKGLAPN